MSGSSAGISADDCSLKAAESLFSNCVTSGGGDTELLRSASPGVHTADKLGFEAAAILDGTDSELLMLMLLKCADLSHTVLPTKLHVAWSARLEEEVRSPGKRIWQIWKTNLVTITL